MDIEKIYFDMDGVLADFDRGVAEMCGINPLSQENRSEESDIAFWEKIKQIEHFYDKLEPMKGAFELFDAVYSKYGDKCQILTGIPKPRRGILTAGEDKKSWAHRLLSNDVTVNIVFKEDKPKYCTGKKCVLIDDFTENIMSWEQSGGTGVLHISAERTFDILKKLEIL